MALEAKWIGTDMHAHQEIRLHTFIKCVGNDVPNCTYFMKTLCHPMLGFIIMLPGINDAMKRKAMAIRMMPDFHFFSQLPLSQE